MAGFLESGCGLIVGLVRPDGVPFAIRAWGLDVLDPSAGTDPRARWGPVSWRGSGPIGTTWRAPRSP